MLWCMDVQYMHPVDEAWKTCDSEFGYLEKMFSWKTLVLPSWCFPPTSRMHLVLFFSLLIFVEHAMYLGYNSMVCSCLMFGEKKIVLDPSILT